MKFEVDPVRGGVFGRRVGGLMGASGIVLGRRARQSASEICGLTTMRHLRAATSDPHHLRFAQPRAIGLKVSDEFTVPLCRGHSFISRAMKLLRWKDLQINALEIARGLWEQTHPASVARSIHHADSEPTKS